MYWSMKKKVKIIRNLIAQRWLTAPEVSVCVLPGLCPPFLCALY